MSGATSWSHTPARAPSAPSSSHPSGTSTAPSLQPTTRGIDLGGWSVRVTSGPIGSSAEMDALSEVLGIPPPEMAFPHNSLVLQHAASGFSLCFDAVRALRSIDGVQSRNRLHGIDCRESAAAGKATRSSVPGAKPPKKSSSIKVAYAKEWGKSRNDFITPDAAEGGTEAGTVAKDAVAQTDITTAKDYDWTYSTTWAGSVGDVAPPPLLSETPEVPSSAGLKQLVVPEKRGEREWFGPGTDPARDRIPVERLGASSGEPILFYDDIVLYEDELADNGSSIVNVKVRVMPSGFLVLQRFFLRVDDVLFRVFDTRLYCQFTRPADGTAHVPRPLAGTAVPRPASSLPTGLGQLSLGAPRTSRTSPSMAGEADMDEGETEPMRLIRECSGSQAPYALVRSRLPPYRPHDLSPLTDVNWVSSTLATISRSALAAYHSAVASGTQLPRMADKDALPGAKFLAPSTSASRFPGAGFAGSRPGERLDLSPAQAPTHEPAQAHIVGQIDESPEHEWPGSGARVDIALLKS
ncbi:hypothetical protein PaG_03148 [Moesziomyces aphidis]|uniref:Uncharacterized protein n=1 Tax=Moesziomyces aphidis TaxID=84754 RepID=W3VP02_MOEAP|nr:hypothetical protein PaG_03148 [Moesziomyces aphidis]